MIVPLFWSESRIQERVNGRQLTVRRFGWSDISQSDADAHAAARTKEAFDRIASGQKLNRRELKVAYNGSDDLPIREQVIETTGNAVVTRNSYGARCLNTPNVFFADIDFPDSDQFGCTNVLTGVIIAGAASLWVLDKLGSILFALLTFVVAVVYISLLIAPPARKLLARLRGSHEEIAIRHIDAFIRSHPDWCVRIYRTSNGFRVMALHRLFDPRSDEVAEAFRQLKVDRTYAIMCEKQHCFRARLTAKPWRIGISGHMKPRPGVWPVSPERLQERDAWIMEYEKSADKFAACRLIKTAGTGIQIHPEADTVRQFHDRICRAETELPLA